MKRYDVFHLHHGDREWRRFALFRTLKDARTLARCLRGLCAVWIRPYEPDAFTIPVQHG